MRKLIIHLKNLDIIIAAFLIIIGSILLSDQQLLESLHNVMKTLPKIISPFQDVIEQVLSKN